eukprot:7476766-Alexandrium_andersonii.AAC.1
MRRGRGPAISPCPVTPPPVPPCPFAGHLCGPAGLGRQCQRLCLPHPPTVPRRSQHGIGAHAGGDPGG